MTNQVLSASQRDWIAARSRALLQELTQDACVLGLDVSHLENGATMIDCGVNVPGSLEAGRRITEISQGGMASARIGITEISGIVLPELVVDSWLPKLSAYGLQVSVALSEIDPAIRISGPILARFAEGRLDVLREESIMPRLVDRDIADVSGVKGQGGFSWSDCKGGEDVPFHRPEKSAGHAGRDDRRLLHILPDRCA